MGGMDPHWCLNSGTLNRRYRGMDSDLGSVLRLEVPVIVRLGERRMPLREVLALVPGSIIELPKNAEAELDLLVNNKQIGLGAAVKVGENFGLRITYLGDVRERIEALGGGHNAAAEGRGDDFQAGAA
jgi:flagellar motor switch protein FliN